MVQQPYINHTMISDMFSVLKILIKWFKNITYTATSLKCDIWVPWRLVSILNDRVTSLRNLWNSKSIESLCSPISQKHITMQCLRHFITIQNERCQQTLSLQWWMWKDYSDGCGRITTMDVVGLSFSHILNINRLLKAEQMRNMASSNQKVHSKLNILQSCW